MDRGKWPDRGRAQVEMETGLDRESMERVEVLVEGAAPVATMREAFL